MLAAVLGCKSSDGFPATVTRPGFSVCLSWRWLPRVATTSQPSSARSRRTSRTFPPVERDVVRARGAAACLDEAVERRPDVGESVGEEVAVRVERHVDRRVAELGLEELRCAPAATINAA
jgi:hypothetical protein